MENKKYHNVGTVPKIIVGRGNIDASKTHSRRLTFLAYLKVIPETRHAH
jgi:hypothetical protein